MSDEVPRTPPRRVRMRRPRNARRRLSGFSVNRMVPNILTVLALCAGMTAIRFAMSGNFPAAVYAIMIAAVLDGLDGRIARLLRATSHFGAELDLLSDFISFGVAPAGSSICGRCRNCTASAGHRAVFRGVLRLETGAVQHAAGVEAPAHSSQYFTGVPAPAGAGLAIMPMFAAFEWGDWIVRSPYFVGVWVTGVALLMVSTIPTVSLKKFRIPPHLVVPTLLGIGILAGFLTTAPWPTITAILLLYLGSIPWTVRSARRTKAAAAARKPAEPAETPALAPPSPHALGEGTAPTSDLRH